VFTSLVSAEMLAPPDDDAELDGLVLAAALALEVALVLEHEIFVCRLV
jgi:hypothetical protein